MSLHLTRMQVAHPDPNNYFQADKCTICHSARVKLFCVGTTPSGCSSTTSMLTLTKSDFYLHPLRTDSFSTDCSLTTFVRQGRTEMSEWPTPSVLVGGIGTRVSGASAHEERASTNMHSHRKTREPAFTHAHSSHFLFCGAIIRNHPNEF